VGAILSAIIFLAIIASFLFFLFLHTIFGSGAARPNQAEVTLQPIVSQIEQLGGEKICDQGDSGYSLDNTIPNYDVYYKVPDTQLLQNIEVVSERQGFILTPDTVRIQDLQNEHVHGEVFNAASSYLAAANNGKKLSITIERNGSLPLDCTNGIPIQQYGKQETISGNIDLVRLSMRLPATH
jgi:hypothetical protein